MAGLALLGGIGFALAGFAGAAGGPSRIREIVTERVTGAHGRLAWIEARGVMFTGGGGLGEGAGITESLLARLEHAAQDESVAGILLELDTPGGSVTDADLVHERLVRLKAQGKKIVVLMGDLCASGGIYAAVAADKVLAHPTTITGSIGVIISALNVSDLMANYGIKDTSITSGPNKAMLSPTRPVDPEHEAILKGVVDALYQRFVKLVAEGRNLPVEKVRALADGRIYTADQAKADGLIDGIEYTEGAMTALRELTAGGPYDVVRYEMEPALFDLFKAAVSRPDPQSALAARVLAGPRALYMLSPGLTGGGLP